MGHAELAHEVRGQVDAVIALGRQQHPRKSGPTPALRAQRRRLLAALAAKVRLGKGERQVVRGRGAAVRWSDGTLRNRLMDYLQGKTVSGT
jgi:hypothetical protein